MAKRKYSQVNPTIVCANPYTAEEQETRYKKDYEFNKAVPARSPTTGWENKYIREGNSDAPPKEVAMVKGTPHKFKHRRTGNSYGSRPATRKAK